MALTPLIVVVVISFYMIYGAAVDDGEIMGIIILGMTIFFVGTGMLILLYFTNILSGFVG